jgi:hypothetical protein
VDDDTLAAFISTFVVQTGRAPSMAASREQWTRQAMAEKPDAVRAWRWHAQKTFVDVARGMYSARRALAFLNTTVPAGEDADTLLRVALAGALNSLEGAAS